jgi:hypothetical protein
VTSGELRKYREKDRSKELERQLKVLAEQLKGISAEMQNKIKKIS